MSIMPEIDRHIDKPQHHAKNYINDIIFVV